MNGCSYRGEKLERSSGTRKCRKDRDVDDWTFSSVYDKHFTEGEDSGRHHRNARSQEPTLLKYRKIFVKTSGSPSSGNTAKKSGVPLTNADSLR